MPKLRQDSIGGSVRQRGQMSVDPIKTTTPPEKIRNFSVKAEHLFPHWRDFVRSVMLLKKVVEAFSEV